MWKLMSRVEFVVCEGYIIWRCEFVKCFSAVNHRYLVDILKSVSRQPVTRKQKRWEQKHALLLAARIEKFNLASIDSGNGEASRGKGDWTHRPLFNFYIKTFHRFKFSENRYIQIPEKIPDCQLMHKFYTEVNLI